MRRWVSALLAGVVLLGAGTGCARRTIDEGESGSVSVPGTGGSLKKFCDGSILIYWTPGIGSGADDDYEFIVYDGCTPDGVIINGKDINPGTPSVAPSAPRTEDLQQGEEDED